MTTQQTTDGDDTKQHPCPICKAETDHEFSHTATVRGTKKQVYQCPGCEAYRVVG